MSKCDLLPDVLAFSDLTEVSVCPDLSKDECLLSLDMGQYESEFVSRAWKGLPFTPTSPEQVVGLTFSQICRGLARHAGD